MRSQRRIGHCSSSMGSFAPLLGRYYGGCDYGNKPIDLLFHEFSSTFAARSSCSKKIFTLHIYIYILLVRSVLVMIFVNFFRRSVFSFGYFKELLNLEQLSSKIECVS